MFAPDIRTLPWKSPERRMRRSSATCRPSCSRCPAMRRLLACWKSDRIVSTRDDTVGLAAVVPLPPEEEHPTSAAAIANPAADPPTRIRAYVNLAFATDIGSFPNSPHWNRIDRGSGPLLLPSVCPPGEAPRRCRVTRGDQL